MPDLTSDAAVVDLTGRKAGRRQDWTFGASAFAVATTNIGAASQLVVTAEPTPDADTMGALTICRTDTQTGLCNTPRSNTLSQLFPSDGQLTFAVFVRANGEISKAPARNRIIVRFSTPGGQLVGASSVAVRTVE